MTRRRQPAVITDLPAVKKRIEDAVQAEMAKRAPPAPTATGIERIRLENVKGKIVEILADLRTAGFDDHDPTTWPPSAREEIFSPMQMAWAASSFRRRDAAELLGVDGQLIEIWLESPAYAAWARDGGRRHLKLGVVADLALQRAAEILLYDTRDPRILALQGRVIGQVLGANKKLTSDPPPPPPPPAPAPTPYVPPPAKPVLEV